MTAEISKGKANPRANVRVSEVWSFFCLSLPFVRFLHAVIMTDEAEFNLKRKRVCCIPYEYCTYSMLFSLFPLK